MADRFTLANRAWPILIDLAARRETMCYEDFADEIGYKTGRMARVPLWPIQDYCIEKGYPQLTSIVVSKTTGLPSSGFFSWEGDVSSIQNEVL